MDTQQIPGQGSGASMTTILDAGFLAWLAFIQFKIGMDLGTLSSLECDFGEKNDPQCVLPDYFLGVFFVCAVLFFPFIAYQADKANRLTVLFTSLWVWIAANLIAGFSIGERHIMWWSRIFVAYGCAAFLIVAYPLVNDFAPKTAKARWMSVLPITYTAGGVAGFIYGRQAEGDLDWLFRAEAFAMIPMSFLCFLPIFRMRLMTIDAAEKAKAAAEGSDAAKAAAGSMFSNPLAAAKGMAEGLTDAVGAKSLSEKIKEMLTTSTYIFTLLGNLSFFFAVGGMNIFLEELFVENFQAAKEDAWLTVGLLFLIAGLAGPLLAGIILDYQTSSLEEPEGVAVSNFALSDAKICCLIAFFSGLAGVWIEDYSISLCLMSVAGIFAMTCLVFIPMALLNFVGTEVKHWSLALAFSGCSIFQAAVAMWLVRFVGDVHGLDIGFSAGLCGFLVSAFLWHFGTSKTEQREREESISLNKESRFT